MADRDLLVVQYFERGYTYKEILHALSALHSVTISLRLLHRILRSNNLYRKGHASECSSVINFIESQLNGSGSSVGYRQMHQRCVRHGLRVNRNIVATTIRCLDPNGVEVRKRKCLRRRLYFARGPNWA